MKKLDPKLNHIAPAWFHERWEALTAFIRSIVPREGPGIKITDAEGEGGCKIEVAFQNTTIFPPRPFEVRAISNEQVRVTPGAVNNFEPVTMGGAEDWVFNIGEDEVKYIYLKVALDGPGIVSDPELWMDDTVPDNPEGNPDTGTAPPVSHRMIARVARTGAAAPVINNYVTTSQWVATWVAGWTCDEQVIRVVWVENFQLP